MTVSLDEWETFFARQVVPAAVEYRSLVSKEDPESEPFRSRYAAAETQRRLLERCNEFEPQATTLELHADGRAVPYHTVRGRLLMRYGLALAETDLTAKSRELLEQAAACLERAAASDQDVVGLVVILNTLGMLLNNGGEHTAALPRLDASFEVYCRVKGGSASTACSQALAQMERDSTDAAQMLEEAHTRTLYYLAQVHQNAGHDTEAAKFCAATLQRQAAALSALQRGNSFSIEEWVTNAASLAGVYVSRLHFACAEQLLHASSAVLRIGEGDPASGVGDEARPALEVAWARYYLTRLDASIDWSEAELPKDLPSALPEHLHFPTLGLPPTEALPWGRDAYAHDFAQARELFNAAVPRLRTALKFYQLDGWVSDHVHLLFDISKAALALFETDPHRTTVMHRQRIKVFDDVRDGALSRQHFDGLVKSIALEVAQAMRQIWNIKDNNGWPRVKVEAANCAAADAYAAFLELFRQDGMLPAQLEEAWEAPVLKSAVLEGRLRLQQSGTQRRERSLKVEALLRYARDYQRRHKVKEFEEEAMMAGQMHELVTQQLDLSKRTHG